MKKYSTSQHRRTFVKTSASALLGAAVAPLFLQSCKTTQDAGMSKAASATKANELFFKMSLAQWSYNKALFKGDMDTLGFISKARELGLPAVEYVNQFFKDKAEDMSFLNQLNQRAKDEGIYQNLIMIDREGDLGTLDTEERTKAIENHYKWVNAAKYLGCGSIRVNARGTGSAGDVSSAAIDGLSRLSEYAAKENINVIVENHGGYSSNGKWMANVLKNVGMDNCGSLPDFGNFCITRSKEDWTVCEDEYDRYQGMMDLMPYAKAVSAKSNDFDADGNEIHTDFMKIMKIVKDAGFRGYVNIEYEGRVTPPEEGVILTKKLLEKVGKALS